MPKATDTDLNRQAQQKIVFTANVDCPECETIIDAAWPTEAYDEDGLADIVPEELTTEVTCPSCSHVWTATYDGWMNYGDA